MKCKNCNKDMKLRLYQDYKTYNPKSERFIYECSNCGILANAKSNINYKEDYNKKANAVLKDLQDFSLIVEKEALEFLIKHPNPFPIISMLSRKDKKIITISELNKEVTNGN